MAKGDMDLELLIRLVGADRVQSALKKIAEQQDQNSNKHKKHNEEAKKSSGILDAAASAAWRFILAWGSLGQITAIFSRWLGNLREAMQLLSQMGDQAMRTQEAVLRLADQLGDTSEKGLNTAAAKGADIARAGGLPSIEIGAEILQSVLSSINAPEQIQFQIAKEIAKLAGKSKIDVVAAGAVAELIQAGGASGSIEDARRLLAELDASLKASSSLSMGSFSEAAIKGGVGMLSQGMKPAEVFELMAQARTVSGGSDMVAGQTIKILTQSMGRDKIREHLKKRGAIDRPLYEQVKEMEKLFISAEGGNKEAFQTILDTYEAEERVRLTQLFSAPARAMAARTRGMVGTADPAVFQKQADDFIASKLGIGRAMDVSLEQQNVLMGRDQFSKAMLARLVERRKAEARIDDPFGFSLPGGEAVYEDVMRRQMGGSMKGLENTRLAESQYLNLVEGAVIGEHKSKWTPGQGGGGTTINIGTYVNQQVAPRSDPVTLPASNANARPGVR